MLTFMGVFMNTVGVCFLVILVLFAAAYVYQMVKGIR